jgi:hypothetical protein
MSLGIGRSIALSGAVMGIAGGLLLWLLGYVGPILFIPFIIIGAVIGAVVFGVPAILFERKVEREKQEAVASPGAGPASPYVVINVAPQGRAESSQPQSASSSVVNIPVYATQAGASAGPSATAPGGPADRPPRAWPPVEPLCVMETSDEKEVWKTVRAASLPVDRVLGFTTRLPEDIAVEFGLTGITFLKISRVQGDKTVDPGDLDRIGSLIEMHFAAGQGRYVALPCLENLVQAGNVANVRRLLEVARDLASQSRGSMLVSVDRASLPESIVATLERGNFRL